MRHSITIEDKCNFLPKIYTQLEVLGDRNRLYEFGMDCGEGYYDKIDICKVYYFVQYILNLVQKKEEVKKAPKSDVIVI